MSSPRPPGAALVAALAMLPSVLAPEPPHGAVYHQPHYAGPGDRVPPSTAPPPGGGGPTTGGPSQPAAPGRTGGRRPRPGPSAPLPRAPLARGRSGLTGGADEPPGWELWWELSREGLLGLRRRLLGAEGPHSAAAFLGFESRTAPERLRPTPDVLRARVLPVLLGCLVEDGSTDLATASAIALARIANDLDEASATRVAEALCARLAHPEQEVSETAALALGILGRDASAPLLAELLGDAPEGRRWVARSAVPDRTRVFAAYGLGLVARRSADAPVRAAAAAALAAGLRESAAFARPDLPVACVIALSRVPLPDEELPLAPRQASGIRTRADVVRLLLARTGSREGGRLVQAHATAALGACAAGEGLDPALRNAVVRALTRRLAAHEADAASRRGATLALGALVAPQDEEACRQLIAAAERGAEPGARLLAHLALGQAAARCASTPAIARSLRAPLLSALEGSGDRARWSALALGLELRTIAGSGRETDQGLGAALVHALEGSSAPADLAALAAACSLAEPADAGPALRAALDRVALDGPRAGLFLALGMVRSGDALVTLRATLREAAFRPMLLREAALALALLGDPEVGAALVERLAAARSGSAQAALAQALGRIGEASSLLALARLAADSGRPSGARAFAAAALGQIGDRDLDPWSLPYAQGCLFTDLTETLVAPAGNGVLDIL